MLAEIAETLDRWIVDQNVELRAEGLPLLRACEIRVFGQAALLELRVPLALAATRDVDARFEGEYVIQARFHQLLDAEGWQLDPLGHEAWMPRETRYLRLFQGEFVTLLVAEAEAILVSKALKAPAKNRTLLAEYLAGGASERFFELAESNQLNLEQLL